MYFQMQTQNHYKNQTKLQTTNTITTNINSNKAFTKNNTLQRTQMKSNLNINNLFIITCICFIKTIICFPNYYHAYLPKNKYNNYYYPRSSSSSSSSSSLHLNKKRKTRITKWSFFPIQYYNTKLSTNAIIEKWKINKDISIQEIYNNKTKLMNNNKQHGDYKNKNISSISSLLGTREIRKVNLNSDLDILYIDEHIIVINKPSGILSVPGPNRKSSMLDVIYTYFAYNNTNPDQMVCHRLDMDTSGIIIYARTIDALCVLQTYFRPNIDNTDNNKKKIDTDNNNNKKKKKIKKVYEALLCGFIYCDDGDIDLPLESNIDCLPFVCVAKHRDHNNNNELDINGATNTTGTTKYNKKNKVKESFTYFEVIKRELLYGCYPVTRVKLIPFTGRTHQLRVHCAAIGHPIVADPIYGLGGVASNVTPFINKKNHKNEELLNPLQSQQQPLLHESIVEKYNMSLCLHAKQLFIYHPITQSPMIFECDPPF